MNYRRKPCYIEEKTLDALKKTGQTSISLSKQLRKGPQSLFAQTVFSGQTKGRPSFVGFETANTLT